MKDYDPLFESIPNDVVAPKRLADILEIDDPALDRLCDNIDEHYRTYSICRNGKYRWIEAPDSYLKRIQRRLLDTVLYLIKATEYAHGFVPGRSILTHALNHTQKPLVITVDLFRFFPSVTSSMVTDVVNEFEFDEKDANRIVILVTHAGHLPQGAPTSPHLANLVLSGMDKELGSLADENGVNYSRYADDLTFSGDESFCVLLEDIKNITNRYGFRLSPLKIHVRRQYQRQMVTGLVVNEGVSIPRKDRRWVRAVLHRARKKGWESTSVPNPETIHGYLSFVRFIHPALGASFETEFKETIL